MNGLLTTLLVAAIFVAVGIATVKGAQAHVNSITDRWGARLEALDPSRPMAYFELAEEIADENDGTASRELARRLFALAAVLDPADLARSACLALAELEETAHGRRRMVALADHLGAAGRDERDLSRAPLEPRHREEDESPERRAAAFDLSEAFGFYRTGQGTRAAAVLRRDDVAEALDSVIPALPWASPRAFVDACLSTRRRPALTEPTLLRMLQVERILLGGGERTWATELVFSRGRPLIEIDPSRLDEALEVDASRPYYRSGRWVARP